MKNISSRISRLEKELQSSFVALPAIIDGWTKEEIEAVRIAQGDKWPDTVIIDNIGVPVRPARPLNELLAEWNATNGPVRRLHR